MEVREKLVELLKTNACPSPFMCDPTCRYYGYGDCFPDRFADHLIANGVTVQQWIPVTERLPETGEWVLLYTCNNGIVKGYRGKNSGMWLTPGALYMANVTHWMPLPEPPKEE